MCQQDLDMKRPAALAVTFALFATFSANASPGKGSGHGPGRGGMSDNIRDKIHAMLAMHRQMERDMEVTKTGYRFSTTSTDQEVVVMIQQHGEQLRHRVEEGMAKRSDARSNEPLKVDEKVHPADLNFSIEPVEGGLVVVVEGKTPAAIKAAQEHAGKLDEKIKKNRAEFLVHHDELLASSVKVPAGPAQYGTR
jgi:hypothetical protein